jgi:hypothetical protein
MNNIVDEINKRFTQSHNNEISHLHKPFNDEEEKYIQENPVVPQLVKDRRKNKEERRKKFGKMLGSESGLNYEKPKIEDLTIKDIVKIVNDSIKDENMNWVAFQKNQEEKEKEENDINLTI